MPAAVVHFEVIGKDFETMKRFYGGLFEWQLEPAGPADYALVEPQEGGIGGGVGAAGERGYGVTVYAQVPDLDAALARAEELGGTRVMPPTEVSDTVRVAQLKDPEGHLIGLIQGP
ncbi:MAG TPA: VOC family protein [Thermoleophilaceae bacterium]|nr:VOC family protein [Thermoleophilaceae bacterium]